MKTSAFISLLQDNPSKGLQFQITNAHSIAPTFHITEIKNVSIESVDCGGNPDSYKQTIIQLMVNPLEAIREPWTSQKALSIFEKVDKVKSINKEAEIFFEYGDEIIRTSNFSIEEVEINENIIDLHFYAKPTVCKPSLKGTNATACC